MAGSNSLWVSLGNLQENRLIWLSKWFIFLNSITISQLVSYSSACVQYRGITDRAKLTIQTRIGYLSACVQYRGITDRAKLTIQTRIGYLSVCVQYRGITDRAKLTIQTRIGLLCYSVEDIATNSQERGWYNF